jgi:hypothetical protein
MILPRDLGDTPTEWLELQQELTQWTPLQWQIYGEQIEHEERLYGTRNDVDGLRTAIQRLLAQHSDFVER